jgi:hypothetical protein
MANSSASLLVTGDKDFGELAYRLKLVHHGVLLMRLAGLASATKATLWEEVLATRGSELAGAFTVVSPGRVRIRK